MALRRSDINQIAWLARVAVEESEVEGYLRDVSGILKLVDEMNTVDTEDVEPLTHPLDIEARLREDSVTETDRRDLYQQQGAAVNGGYYLVPKVIGSRVIGSK